jgi:hypothetical protein
LITIAHFWKIFERKEWFPNGEISNVSTNHVNKKSLVNCEQLCCCTHAAQNSLALRMLRDKRLISALVGYTAVVTAKGDVKNSYIIPFQLFLRKKLIFIKNY